MEWKNGTTYQAAANVAGTIEQHFLRHLDEARAQQDEEGLASVPTARQIEQIIDVAFWASLRKEEGLPTRISIAFLQPTEAGKPLLFEHRLPYSPKVLAKLAPGVERAGVHVGVWEENGEMVIWGTTLTLPKYCFVLDVSEPGLLVVKHRRAAGLGKFINVAVLQGDSVKVVNEQCGIRTDCPNMLTSLLGIHASPLWNHPVNVLIQIAVSMRAHRRGGTLLVTPHQHDKWKESIVQPLTYPVSPAFSGVADLIRQDGEPTSEIYWQNALRREVAYVTGLTAVDGATVINDLHELLAFGTKITRAANSQPVEEVLLTEPVTDRQPLLMHPSRLGGTRHLSAAQFVYDQRDAQALVASQDGYFTVFSWSPDSQIVMAHRIDVLLI
ncbi:putative sensor domain DACNV-containing protein [Chitinophaga caseinilytica]|uniref:putative sensor domain DACNV-containing protein n=1 Tax=Chitinophaga caseinilytica TaxID=2267521 RepID=UPI003C2ECB07